MTFARRLMLLILGAVLMVNQAAQAASSDIHYRTVNVQGDEWHAYFRQFQPPTLIVWGKGDFVFTPAGAEAYRKDLKHVELHMLNAGHFALETNAAEIAGYIRAFRAAQE
jgi:pimeloyl-ACP methyl ester carboxylesterase